MRIAVAGGTGTVGRHVVSAVTASGHEPVVLARSAGVDVVSGAGLATALSGADAVVDVLGVASARYRAAREFFAATTQRLLGAGAAVGVRHHVTLSIVGIDDLDGPGSGYYRAKVEQEALVAASACPTSILRATQFHDFAGQWLDRQRGPVRFVPRMPVRPVAAAEVARALVELAAGEPSGAAGPAELVGPRREWFVDLARRTARARGDRVAVVGLPLPGADGRALRAGALCGPDDAPAGEQTFDDWSAGLP